MRCGVLQRMLPGGSGIYSHLPRLQEGKKIVALCGENFYFLFKPSSGDARLRAAEVVAGEISLTAE